MMAARVDPRESTLRVLSGSSLGSRAANSSVYGAYFRTAIVSVLATGCLLGAIALLGVSLRGSYTDSAWAPYILAHANSQLFGWVGLFVMGFTLLQHPPSQDTRRAYHVLAWGSLCASVVAVLARFIVEPLVAHGHGAWFAVGIGSGVLQAVAIIAFVANITLMRYRSGKDLPWQSKFVFASLTLFVLVAVLEPIVFSNLHSDPTGTRVLFIAHWMPIVRDLQFLGFVGTMIFGVALTKFGTCLGGRTAHQTLGNCTFVVWNAGLALRTYGWHSAFMSDFTDATAYWAGGLVLLTGSIMAVVSLRVFEPCSWSPSVKFLRAAFLWLLVALVLVVLEPFHLAQLDAPFSHAYSGAVRHAVTVGFITQMIIGVGSHVVNRIRSVPIKQQSSLVWTFVLLNLGNCARVGLEIATDYTTSAFAPMGATGFIELVGIAIWGVTMLSLLRVPGHRLAASRC